MTRNTWKMPNMIVFRQMKNKINMRYHNTPVG
jgi:hypothetical protein